MTDRLSGLGEQDSATSVLYEELSSRLEKLQEDGAVDMKAMCSTDRNSSTVDKLWAVNNVLRMSAEGKTNSSIIEA